MHISAYSLDLLLDVLVFEFQSRLIGFGYDKEVETQGENGDERGPVAGDADCLLFPNIESGNVFYKANSKLVAGVRQAGILVGAKVPCVLSSRADSTDTKLNSIAVAAMSV